jgi:hypothetical protein
VLKLFGGHTTQARKLYRDFVQKEARRGRRPELSGDGLVRSLGGWKAIQAMRSSGDRTLGDERIMEISWKALWRRAAKGLNGAAG